MQRWAHLQRAVCAALDSASVAIVIDSKLCAVWVERNDDGIPGKLDDVPSKRVHNVNDLRTSCHCQGEHKVRRKRTLLSSSSTHLRCWHLNKHVEGQISTNT